MQQGRKFTTFFSAKVDPNVDAQIARYESRVVKAYDNMQRAAARASIGPGTGGISGFARGQQRLDQIAQKSLRNTRAQEGANNRLTASQERLQRTLRATATSLNVVQGPLGPLAGRVGAVAQAIEELTGVALGFAAVGASLFVATRLANEYAGIEGRLKALYPEQERVNASMKEVVKIARDARQELSPVADLYVRIASVAEEVGIAQERAGRITELASKAAALSGGTKQTQSAGLGQFAQGIGSGVLSGDELKSVRENTFALAQAIANGLGKTVGELKQLGEQGALTSEVVAEALLNSANQIEARYARLPATLEQASAVFSSSLSVFVGQADQTLGLTTKLAEAVLFLADNLGGLTTVLVGVGAAFASVKLSRFVQEITVGQKGIITLSKQTTERARSILQSSQQFAAASRTEAEAARANVAQIQNTLKARQADAKAARQQIIASRALVTELRNQQNASFGLAGTRTALRNAEIDLTNAQSRLATAGRVAKVSQIELAAASEGLTLAERRQAIATARLERSKAQLASRMSTTGRVTRSLKLAFAELFSMTNILAGAIGLAVGALVAYASRASVAERATKNLTDAQRSLAEAADGATRALARQNVQAGKVELAKRRQQSRENRAIVFEGAGDLRNELTRNSFRGNDKAAKALAVRLAALERSGKVLNIDQLRKEVAALEKTSTNPGALLEALDQYEVALKSYGFTLKNVKEAQADLDEAFTSSAAEKAIKSSGGSPVSAAALRAQAEANAADSASTKLQAANRRFKAAKIELDKEFGVSGGKLDSRKAAEYQKRYEALVRQRDAEAQAGGGSGGKKRSGSSELEKQAKAQERVFKAAERYGEKRRDILQQYAEESTAIAKAQDQIDDLYRLADRKVLVEGAAFIGKTAEEIEKIKKTNPLGKGIYTQEMAQADAETIEQGVRRPLRDVYDQMELNRSVQGLLLNGYDLEANALQKTLEIYREIGEIPDDLLEKLIEEERQQERINDTLRSRQRIIDQYIGTADVFKEAVGDLLMNLQDGPKAFKNFFKTIQTAFQRQIVTRITEGLFANTESKLRAQTRGTDGLTNASDILAGVIERDAQRREEQNRRIGKLNLEFGDEVEQAADAVQEFATAVRGATADITGQAQIPTASIGAGAESAVQGIFKSIGKDIGSTVKKAVSGVLDANGDIVVTGSKASSADISAGQIPEVKTAFTTALDDLLSGLDQLFGTKFLKGLGGSLTDAMEGAARGSFASGIAGALGLKQSKTGAAIGGAIGSFLPIPGGDIIGGLIGGTIGGLFKKAKFASSTISLDQFGNLSAGAAVGNNKAAKGQANDAAGSVVARITEIANALGGDLTGTPSISIGSRNGKIRVDPTGRGITKTKKGAVDFGDDADAAIAFAVKKALEQGVITGISEASKRILQSGQDLQAALEKATIIESIPKRLLAKTDPVRAAVEELNREFERTIRILKEAGATDQQYSDAFKLYTLERAEAIEEASQRAGSAIEEYLQSLRSGSESPFSKRTTFLNAQADLLKFEADILAGKAVDNDKLLAAAQNFEEASSRLNGRDINYFDNLNFLTSLLTKAKENVAGTASTNLPGSPFDADQQVKDAIARAGGEQVTAIGTLTNVVTSGLQDVVAAIIANGGIGTGILSGEGASLLNRLPNYTIER